MQTRYERFNDAGTGDENLQEHSGCPQHFLKISSPVPAQYETIIEIYRKY